MYTIQHTASGRFLVRRGPREMGQFASQDEAERFVAERQRDDAAASHQRETSAQQQEMFCRQHPDLVSRQMAWQKWRSEEYDQRTRALRNLSREAAHHCVGTVGAAGAEYADRKVSRVAGYLAEAEADMNDYHARITAADSGTKAAIRNLDAVAWAVALEACEKIT